MQHNIYINVSHMASTMTKAEQDRHIYIYMEVCIYFNAKDGCKYMAACIELLLDELVT